LLKAKFKLIIGQLQADLVLPFPYKVTTKRIAVGKWGCNSGQACIAPDYIITTKSFAPELVGIRIGSW